MRRLIIIVAVIATCLVFVGCGALSGTGEQSTTSSTTTAVFLTSSQCSSCHDNLTDEQGTDYSFVESWSGSVHAAASIDPYYLATVRDETLAIPTASDGIQDICATCHLPMANLTSASEGSSTAFLDNAAVDDGDIGTLYHDAVSCLVCHEITPDSVADPEASASGNFSIDMVSAHDRVLYGRYELSDTMKAVMENSIGYTAVTSDDLTSSAFCATCHTLYTDTLDENGEPTGTKLPEQVPYLEWSASSYAPDTTCQSCHMQTTPEPVKLAIGSDTALGPAALHTFSGGNAYLLTLLADESTNQTAVEKGIDTTTANLQSQTATLSVDATREEGTLGVTVDVSNLTGHKFPTAFPSRRAWLHVTVTDSSGDTVFESGAWNQKTGSIVGNDNDSDASTYEPHYDVIDSPDQVQIYESILGDGDGAVTTVLLHAKDYLKDNRLLPTGFDKTTVDADVAVAGDAVNDPNFTGGSDSVAYEVPVSDTASGKLTVTVELAYQSMGYRWLENLNTRTSEEQSELAALTAANPNAPVIVASTHATVS